MAATPRSPRLVHKAAVDALNCALLDTFRGKEVPPEGGEPRWPERCWLPMHAGGEPGVVDMSNWARLDEHTREALNLERDPLKMQLTLRVEIKVTNVEKLINIPIDGPSSLYLFRRQFDVKMSLADVQAIDKIEIKVEQRPILNVAKATKARKGKHAQKEKQTRDLGIILYGEDSAGKQQQQATWDEECDYFMAKNPVRLCGMGSNPRAHSRFMTAMRFESHASSLLVGRKLCAATSAHAR